MSRHTNRRDFLAAAGLTAGTLATGALSAYDVPENRPQDGDAARPVAPSEKIVVGLIGCGGMGRGDLKAALRLDYVECAAVCDVDARHLGEAQKEVADVRGGKQPEGYADYRKLIDRKDIDVVIIGTPDHWHAIPFIEACQAGKDVYVEKPIAHNIREGRAMVEAARKHKRVVQVGTQQRSGRHFQKAIEIVKSGVLGAIAQTRTWNIDNDFWGQPVGNPPDGDPPKELDYDMWLGPAPKRPYNEKRCHYYWRWFLDYGSAKVGDWNVHLQDIVHLAMGVDSPRSVAAMGGTLVMKDIRECYDTLEVLYDYGSFTQIYSYRSTCNWAAEGRRYGIQFFGTNGSLFVDREGIELFPDTYQEDVDGVSTTKSRTPAVKLGGSDQHWPHVKNFFECVKSRGTPNSPIDSMHMTTTVCHLANISLRCGHRVYWDAAKEICTDKDGRPDEAANQYLAREYRSPWKLPQV